MISKFTRKMFGYHTKSGAYVPYQHSTVCVSMVTEYYTPLVDKCWYGPLRLSGEDRWEDRAKLTTVAKKGYDTFVLR